MPNNNKLFGDTSAVSVIKDPFCSENIESITLRTYRNWFERGFTTSGTVEFKNGNTEGKQQFEASNLSELFMKIYKFCQSLPT